MGEPGTETPAVSKYDTTVDLGDRNNSHTLMVELVGANKRVLDLGCSTGYLARVLADRGCTVSGVEYDAAAAEQARPALEQLVVGDLEQLDLDRELGGARFDVVVMGDVLEHLRDPLPVLRAVRPLLAPGGWVVISIPNVAHASVRLSLLLGRFDYRDLGLLDNTHLRFFTRASLSGLLQQAGFAATDFLRTTAGAFETELGVRADEVDPAVVERVLADEDALTYQFVVRAVPDSADERVRSMRAQLEARVAELEAQLAEAQGRLDRADEVRRAEVERAHEAAAEHVRAVRVEVEAARLGEREAREQARRATEELQRLLATRTLRATRVAREAYGRLRTEGRP